MRGFVEGFVFTLLSYNCFSAPFANRTSSIERYRQQVEYINATKPDIVCIQEFNVEDAHTIYSEGMSRLGYSSYYEKRKQCFFGSLPFDGKTTGFGRFLSGPQTLGLGIWWKGDILEPLHARSVPFHWKGRDPLNLFRDRGFLDICLRPKGLKQNTVLLRIVCTHMNIVSQGDRQKQGAQIVRRLRAAPECPTVVAGDFNTFGGADEPVLQGFTDASFARADTGPTLVGTNNQHLDWFGRMMLRKQGSKTLDHVFVRGAQIERAETVSEQHTKSDHRGVVVTVRVSPHHNS